jgi:hypothetical protein
MLSVTGFFSVALPASFSPSFAALLSPVSGAFSYPSCLCLPLCLLFASSLIFSPRQRHHVVRSVLAYLHQYEYT